MKKKKKTGHDDSADLRKRAEEALRESEENFKALAENANDGILIATGDEGWHVYANRRAIEITGYPIEELLKTRIRDLAYPEELPKLAERYKKRLAGLEVQKPYETALVNKDGIKVPIEISPSKTIWQNQLADMVIFRDITVRKRVEEALRESEVRYKELWERAPVAYHVLDPDGKIAKVNQTEASTLGYQVHEMVGKSIFDFILPEQRDEAQKRFCQKIQGLPIPRIENRIYLKKDGSRIYVVIDDVLERDAHKKITGIRSTMTDITDRKRIEEELIKSEKKYRSLVQTAGSGIATIDQRGIFTFVNETLCRMCGYPEQELIGKHFVDFLHPDDRKNAIQIFENAFINPIENPYIEFRIIHKDGHIVYVCSNPTAFEYEGQLLGFNAIITDITERKRAEEALRESEERYRRLVETAPEAIYNLSAKDGTITLLNPAFERITGWSRAEWLGKPFMPLVHPDDLTLAMETFQHVLRGEPTPPYELRILSKSGEYLIGEFTSFPHIEKRKVIGEFGIVRDITERKKAEKEIQNLAKFPSENPNPVLRIARDGLLLYVNGAGVRQLADLHLQVGQATPPMLREVVFQVMENRSAQVLDLEHRERAYSFFVAPVVEAGYANLYGLDITARKRSEDALRESEEKYRSLASTVDSMYLVDRECRYIFMNERHLSRFGLSWGEVFGRSYSEFHSEEDTKHFVENIERVFETGKSFQAEHESQRDNKYFLRTFSPVVDSRGSTFAITVVSKDITERKRVEEALRESEERFRTLYENSTVGLYRTTPDGRIDLANPALVRMLGYSSFDDLSTRNLEISGFEPSYPRTQFVEIIEKDGEVKGLESAWKRKDGTIIFVRESARAIRDSQAKTLYYDGTVEDITERKRAEEAVRKSEEKYRGLTENINLGIYRNTVGPEGKFIEANPANIKMFGYNSKEEFLAMNVSDLYQNPEDRNKFNDKMLKEGFVRGEELWLKKKDGSLFIGSVSAVAVKDEQGHVKYYDGIIEDITERKRVEDALRFTRLSLDNAVDAMVCTSHDARFKDVNDAFCRSVGYSREELLSKTVHDIDPNYSAEVWPEFWKKLKQSGSLNFETCHHTKAGKAIPVEITAKFFEHNGKEYHCGFARDITERKRTEEALQVNLEKYRVLFESFPLGITISDKSGKIIETNRQSEQLLGITADVHAQRRVDSKEWQIIRKDGTPMPADEYASTRALRENRLIENVEMGIVKDKGEITWISVTAAPIPLEGYGVAIAYGDITERKRAEEALLESEERYRNLFTNVPIGLYRTTPAGEWLDGNAASARMLGYPDRESMLKANPLADYINPEERERWKAILEKNGVLEDFESQLRRQDGRIIWVKDNARAIKNKEGRVLCYEGAMVDFTERKKAEAERERLLTELEAQNRELESFVYTVSHDLKAPLVSMSGFSSALKKEYENQLAEKGKHYLERIQANVAQMDSLIANLLELSRLGQVVEPTEGIDVAALLREIRDALAIRLKEAGAKLVVQEPLPTVRADRIRIRQVFVNLIDNAVKFKSTERALRIEVGCRQQSGFHCFHVTDNGIGIPHKYQDQIFAPFQKLHSEIEGVGIGLALVKKIVEHHGGRVWLESPSAKFIPSKAEGIGAGNEGAGATFYFTLPIESGVKPLS